MKILKIALIFFMALVFLVIGACVIFILTFDVNRFKPQILSEAGKALNRKVDFEKASLGISWTHGINLKVSNLVIDEDPAFGKADFLAVKNISVAIDVLKYVLKKEVNVPSVFIDSLRVTIIRQKDGALNVLSIAQPTPSEAVSGAPATEGVKPVSGPAAMALPAILVSSVKSSHGLVTFVDQAFDPPLRLEITDLEFSFSNISLDKSFPFIVEAEFLSAKKNIKIEGRLQINLATNEMVVSEFKGTTELSHILLDKIPEALPMTKGAVLPKVVRGKLDIALKSLTAGPKGLAGLSGDVVLSDGFLQFQEIASPVKVAKMRLNINDKKIILDKTLLSIGQGLVNVSGVVDDYLVIQDYQLQADAQNLIVQDLVSQEQSPVKAEGVVSGNIKCKGQGFSPDALQTTLSGEADIFIKEAKLKDINVLRTVLDKIAVIPGLAQKVEEGLSERYRQKLTQQDTVISDVQLPLTIENGRIAAEGVVLTADEFMFKGSGGAGFDSSYSLEGSFLVPQELSKSMVAQVAELQYLLDEKKQIDIPLKISGRAGEPKFSVDAEYITKRLFMNQAKQQLFKVINKAAGIKEEPLEEAGRDVVQSDSQEEHSVGDLVTGVLGAIFNKKE